MKKSWFSVGLAGLIALSVSLPQAQATETTFHELTKQKLIHSTVLNQVQTKSVSKAATAVYLWETEPNNDFLKADAWSYTKPIRGNLQLWEDEDFYKITIPNDGKIVITGTSNNSNIDLVFGVNEKNGIESPKLVFLEKESSYTDGVEVQKYQAKAGTYYVVASDWDFYETGIDDNTKNDFYTLKMELIDNVKPGKPTVNKVDNNDKTVTGKAEANSTITIKSGSKKIATAKTSAKGTFSAKIAGQKAGTKLSVTATDSAKNVSSSVSVTVADVVAPSKPTINKVDDNDTKVTGKAEAGSSVVVKAGGKTLGSATADSKGVYSVKIKAQKKGTTLTVTAKDKAGNTSAKKTYVVVKH